MIFDSIVFGGQAKCIPAHGIKNIITLKSFLSCNDIKRGVRPGMTYMKTLTAGVRKFNKAIKFRQSIIILSGKGILRIPYILPFFFNLFKIIIHNIKQPFLPQNKYEAAASVAEAEQKTLPKGNNNLLIHLYIRKYQRFRRLPTSAQAENTAFAPCEKHE